MTLLVHSGFWICTKLEPEEIKSSLSLQSKEKGSDLHSEESDEHTYISTLKFLKTLRKISLSIIRWFEAVQT